MLKDVVVEGDLDVIDEQAFYGLDSIEMMVFNRVVNVATDCIGYCEKLEKITFNGPVTQIGLKAIANCPNLKFVNFKQGLESKQEPVHSNCPMLNGLNVISKKQGQDDSFEYKIY